ncbi:aspartyl/asparaginyl beta-hydroxylase domain-containing protein [Bordetella hinzii]|uniref:Aspartyl/asparaginyl beta-hydroxylase domain-containing protein n=1 Tax=Bordetella hinzii TaxID=103855 RepID=A0AAN1S0Q3_9BORD|nr:aspartyl/asparaginyl beta-hydroxylase domain-containing protein [Bordetella hinzii]KXA73782.1 aspartyl beta-hydroxylase [Bordetella hinzii LMG 13501]MBZ0074028.1 aspartyl/asparaginyl beta-hydroxylase domain-containing protein [Bordetella hinzii]MBZ0081308.1 aspartyl/asparaginyl beta-hydroxylase domain-containing protein [Bordetella hinzii]MBZ0083365.1 aspartyl/asparaginyl beta-hydroxylase domain-containing protein [Bordetella hinzii]
MTSESGESRATGQTYFDSRPQTVQPETETKQSLFSKILFRFIDWLHVRIARASKVGDRPIFENHLFPWVPALEAQTPAIRAELEQLLAERERLPAFHEISPDVGMITGDDQWKTFVFMGYGMRSERNLARCPATARALRGIPGVRTAFFSILEAGKRIPLHKGPYNGVLRLHLGLRVPEPREQCWIEVDGQRYAWREGEAVIFDDLYPHQVHNDTEGLRAVLFVDFERPCRAPVRWLNRLVLAAAPMSDEIRRGKANHDAWEKAYYGKNRAG